MTQNDMTTGNIPGLSGYQFSAVRPENLGESEYILVTVAADVSGSVGPYRSAIIAMLKATVEGCRIGPKAKNLLVRVITFSHEIEEIHGFKPVAEINDSDYDAIVIGGGTALYDACSSAIGATIEFAKTLTAQRFDVVGKGYFITDGLENGNSKFPVSEVKDKIDEAITGEVMGSFHSVLIGINTAHCGSQLRAFQTAAGITEYIDEMDVTSKGLARLGGMISRSASSSSTSLMGGAKPAVTF
jgi:uncharacterized protein YegL